jgi:GrpB-like predicted nucleotidyltransferase (UPF0157 family)
VRDYDPDWPVRFQQECRRLRFVVGPALKIEHMGSTSVSGLSAKPIIDILVGLPNLLRAKSTFVRPFAQLGYTYIPEYEAWLPGELFFRKRMPGPWTHHLHIMEQCNPRWRDFLLFRDYLRLHPEIAAAYGSQRNRSRMNLARTSRAFAKQNIGCEGDNRQGAISIREVLFALPQRRDMPCGAAKMSASGPQAGMPTSSSLLEPHSARHGWSSLPSGAWQGPSKELPASLLQIGRQFYFLSQNEDFGIFLLDLWAGAKCFKLLGGQFQYRGNMRTLDVVHGNQIRCWKNGTPRYSELRCGVAGNKQPALLSFFLQRVTALIR